MKEHLVKWEFFSSDEDMNLIYDRFYENPEELPAMEKYLINVSDEGIRKISSFDNLKSSNGALKDFLRIYFETYWRLMVTAGTLRTLDQKLIKELRKVFKDRPDVDNLISIAAIPCKPAFVAQEELEILTLAAKVKQGKFSVSDKEYESEIGRIAGNFSFITLGYFDEKPKERSDYARLVGEALARSPEKVISEKKKNIAEDEKAGKNLINSLGEHGRTLAGISSYASYLKDLYKYSVNRLQYFGEPIFIELSKRSGQPVSFLKDLHPAEMISLIDGAVPNIEMVAERARHNVILAVPGQMETLMGNAAGAFEEKYLAFSAVANDFKGRVASRGYGKGTAKVVRSVSEFHKLNKGDILVVTNTSPDFVAVMKKAAAIVAEDGGITAHVSVVSREFGIPCVVGINNATDIIKDGDTVEVDASSGLVKVVRRA